jgi:hypothetical protein
LAYYATTGASQNVEQRRLAAALVKRYAAEAVELSDAEDVWQILRLARELQPDVGLG